MFLRKFYKKNQSVKKEYKDVSIKTFYSFFNFFKKKSHRIFFILKKNKILLLSLFIAFLISDLLLVKSYNFLISDKKLPPLNLVRQMPYQKQSTESYKEIWKNNIFHMGPIPLQLEKMDMNVKPILSSLPFKLKGTIIHVNSKRSVATISTGSDEKTLSYRPGDVIEKQAEIKEILRAKVVFFNQNNNRLEYIIIPEEDKSLFISYEKDKPKTESLENSLVKRTGDNQFQVKRSDVNDYLQKLPEILKQARVVPHRSERGGEIIGFRFSNIDKGSIFEELGFEKGDIIKEVDDETVTNPEKALELFDRLKGGSGFKILVERNGKNVYYEYSVRENAPIN